MSDRFEELKQKQEACSHPKLELEDRTANGLRLVHVNCPLCLAAWGLEFAPVARKAA